MTTYDYVIITNIPAFYKDNLYSQLSKKCKIHVIYLSSKSKIRESDFVDGLFDYPHSFVFGDVDYEDRCKVKSLFRFLNILRGLKFKKLILPGWELKELMLLSLIYRKDKLAIVIESSISESKTEGLVWFIKKLYINRFSLAFPSGFLQSQILEKANYKNSKKFTYGVGLPNRIKERNITDKVINEKSLKCLYVGRLSSEKNLPFLIDRFKESQHELTIIGSGDELSELQSIASDNVKFKGYIDNKKLVEEYPQYDLFILPSKSEPWGLVIDEALWFGLPVLVSSNVGCNEDLVIGPCSGEVFMIDDVKSFFSALEKISANYEYYRNNVNSIDFHQRDRKQIMSYVDSL
ncbi:glycosyl transferases group 1 family protein [Vibrio parahaemolyticus VP250]|uniref:Glycogen synthase n=1 Tax=Vibrio parahaemolyticus TaxID=670 RepID=A0A7M1VZI9_VIBPH|nr:glycosyltransferase family 4 protein [Vibrio parahaemolyticus]EJG1788567.1 glycosyltransferase family 4 protein [Vibrio parahaemolyticus]EJG1919450.1 glycosyltransferase family 4 protein [Vibrio parahaemolyticus]EQL96328.1 glycosyl transferases group 1 family protein [Vibrio parahaemolyticus VP250]MDG2611333.1 glycosyltransferase family 4 protein [Vibrio parahaemolyticus]QOS20437.1 glycogen synthase [Vibrio parahaemolyticus]